MISHSLEPYRYLWPDHNPRTNSRWRSEYGGGPLARDFPESLAELAEDSRWPAFFPSPMCLVTVADGSGEGLEKVVGASIVNRFPYVMALSFCTRPLSARHHPRGTFTEMLERGGCVAVQYVPPGRSLDRVLDVIHSGAEKDTRGRIAATGLPTRKAVTNDAPVFDEAHLIYEARLVKPGKDFDAEPIYPEPWIDLGSHRVYFLEINAIQLRRDIAEGRSQIVWRSLPVWRPKREIALRPARDEGIEPKGRYQKGYTPHYRFPSAGTIAFEADAIRDGMAVKHLPPLPEDQVEVDNDRARWPCFFPSSAGMITSWADDGVANLMPCGSTTILSRHPLILAPCISYAAINERYAPRASLEILRRRGRFGCGVPFIHDAVLDAIRYAGNTSISVDPRKVERTLLKIEKREWAPVFPDLPIHYECAIQGEVRLGTHIMFLGEVRRIRVREDVTPETPLEWIPWADVQPTSRE
jgi:flavin reductase (DIM6/NTAB) family NADH-FMN oxidoreductase RutF